MLLGVIFGVAACALWGLVYMIPLWLAAYDPMLIALSRYVVFGLFSAVLLLFNGRYLAQVTGKDWVSAIALGVVGNLFYYWLLASAVQLAGAPIAGAFTAVIPICVAIVANTVAKRKGSGVSWGRLVFPLSLVAAGMVCLNWTEFSYFLANSNEPPAGFWLGVFYAFLSLLVWTWYPISNAQWLIAHRRISPAFWTAAQGAATLPAALLGILIYVFAADAPMKLLEPEPGNLIIGVLVLGIVCSWLAIWLWNNMSSRLTPALGGQIIIFETIFAVTYAHLYRQQIPSMLMVFGMVTLLVGVLFSVKCFRGQ